MEWHEVGIIEKKKIHSNIHRPFHLQLFILLKLKKITGHLRTLCYHLDKALNFRVSTPVFSSPGFLPFQRTKSIKSCCYLYSGSMQRPVMVQKPPIKTLGKQKQSWFKKQPQRANSLSFKNSFSETRINFTARNDGSHRSEFQKNILSTLPYKQGHRWLRTLLYCWEMPDQTWFFQRSIQWKEKYYFTALFSYSACNVHIQLLYK